MTIPNISMSVLKLKELVRKKIGPSANGRYLRLIASGRLLAPDKAPLSNFKVADGDVLHAVLAAPGVRGGQQAAMARGLTNRGSSSSRTRRMGGFNLRISDDTDGSDDDDDDDIEEGNERRGFDRLRSTGLSRDEIAAIRLYFSRQVDRFAEQRRNRNENNDENDTSDSNESNRGGDQHESEDGNAEENETPQSRREQRLRLEEEWMEVQGPTSEFRMNLNSNAQSLLMFGGSNSLLFNQGEFGNGGSIAGRASGFIGSDRDFMCGFCLGFFFGFIMLYWVWMPTVSHKQKLGILTGISFQMALNLFKTGGVDNLVED